MWRDLCCMIIINFSNPHRCLLLELGDNEEELELASPNSFSLSQAMRRDHRRSTRVQSRNALRDRMTVFINRMTSLSLAKDVGLSSGADWAIDSELGQHNASLCLTMIGNTFFFVEVAQ